MHGDQRETLNSFEYGTTFAFYGTNEDCLPSKCPQNCACHHVVITPPAIIYLQGYGTPLPKFGYISTEVSRGREIETENLAKCNNESIKILILLFVSNSSIMRKGSLLMGMWNTNAFCLILHRLLYMHTSQLNMSNKF